MALTAKWYFEVAVVNGQNVSAGGEEHPEAVDVFSVEVAPGAIEDKDLLPASAAGKVNFFVLNPSALSDQVSFSFEDLGAAPPPDSFSLEAPVVLIGAGPVGLLPAPPLKLWFKNDTADPVVVDILIGRDATP